MHVPYEKLVLDNGLELLLHEDPTCPLVTVYVVYHVGSSREEEGRTGFAHLFEHVMFEGSKHVAEGEHFRLVQEAGGTLNGNTSPDRTVYFETLPSGELELALWLESDRMGFLLDALSQTTLDNQRDVVKEERRQNYENRPYGIAVEVVARELHPAGHPYSWPTIGSMEDLERASLDDVRSFFRRYYGPNNATVAIGGGFERGRAIELARRYFGALPRGPELPRPVPRPFRLAGPKRVLVEDRVGVPQLQLVWPTPHATHPDAPALEVLSRVLSQNRSSVLDHALTVEDELAAMVSVASRSLELAGAFHVFLRPHEGVSLERLEGRVLELFRELAERGVEPSQLARVRTSHEAEMLRRLELASSRTMALAESNALHGDPEHFLRELERRLAATPEELTACLRRNLVDAPHLALCVVPRGRTELALEGSRPAHAPAPSEPPPPAPEPPDRSGRPAAGAMRPFDCPELWRDRHPNGLALIGTGGGMLPLARLELALPAGHAREPMDRLGLASLVAALLEEGTRRLSTAALQEELDALGATLQVWSDEDEIRLRASVLDEELDALLSLLCELVLEPRFERAEFERARAERLVALRSRAESATGLASDAWPAIVHGTGSRRGAPAFGTLDSVAALSLDDARRYWSAFADPGGARLVAVGAAGPRELRAALEARLSSWTGTRAAPVAEAEPPRDVEPRIALLDRPGAPQSEIRAGHEGLAATHPDYFRFSVLNFVLGGTFSSRLNKNLREDKGYTYGARSAIGGGLLGRPFTASAAVRPEATAAAVREMVGEIGRLRDGLTDEELAFAKEALPRAQVRQYESGWARVELCDKVAKYGWSDRYPEERRRELAELTRGDLLEQARRHVQPDRLRVLVVGDAEKMRGGLEALGLGPVVAVDALGRPADAER